MVDLPTPPLADETAITLRTERMLRFSGRPRWRRGSEGAVAVPERGRPCGVGLGYYISGVEKGRGKEREGGTSGFSWLRALEAVLKRRFFIIVLSCCEFPSTSRLLDK